MIRPTDSHPLLAGCRCDACREHTKEVCAEPAPAGICGGWEMSAQERVIAAALQLYLRKDSPRRVVRDAELELFAAVQALVAGGHGK